MDVVSLLTIGIETEAASTIGYTKRLRKRRIAPNKYPIHKPSQESFFVIPRAFVN